MLEFQLGNIHYSLEIYSQNSDRIFDMLNLYFSPFSKNRNLGTERRVSIYVFNSRTVLKFQNQLDFHKNQKVLQKFMPEFSIMYRRYCNAKKFINDPQKTSSFIYTTDSNEFKKGDGGFENIHNLGSDVYAIHVLDEESENEVAIKIWAVIIQFTEQLITNDFGFLCHSAGVEYNHKGFIFLGKSGAGKTTITKLCRSIGCSPLGDDLNLIQKKRTNSYFISAIPAINVSPVGYTPISSRIFGIFIIIQDKVDFLKAIPPSYVASYTFDAFINDTPFNRKMSGEQLGITFHSICDFARQLPGFELHFRKSTDFWKLIDAEFGLD